MLLKNKKFQTLQHVNESKSLFNLYVCSVVINNLNKIMTCQRRMERNMLNIKLINKIRHTEVRIITKTTDDLIQALTLKWNWPET